MRERTDVRWIHLRSCSSSSSKTSGLTLRFKNRRNSPAMSKRPREYHSTVALTTRAPAIWEVLAFYAILISFRSSHRMNKSIHPKARISDVESLNRAHARHPLLRHPSLLLHPHHRRLRRLLPRHPSLMLLNPRARHLMAAAATHLVIFRRSLAQVVAR